MSSNMPTDTEVTEIDAPDDPARARTKPGLSARLDRILFPVKPRQFVGERWINIVLRSFHVLGVAGIGGGFLFSLDESQWLPFWYLTVATGVTISLLYIWSSALWLFQLKGVSIVLKLALIGIAINTPPWRAELFALVIIISGLIAHAPGRVRGYLILMRSKGDRAGC
jgi:hypothetical protein